ncbi:homocysteine S-methyltransferase [Nocardia sp. BMG111209]|uniref:homocysteine S-methyltransferase n=1 Tax=Nocardia sp. BMG111209 TaxID=1160137 RepID=UPI00037898D1
MISDGGLATELEARGHDLTDALWSARLLLDSPDEIRAVHAAYFRAGARIAITASYQASFEGFAARGLDHAATTRLLRRSVTLAREARDEVAGDGRPRWIAASVGPYGAMLADGSEYRGRYGLGVAALRDRHRPRFEALLAADPDLLALETIPDIDEAVALADLVAEAGFPAWLSYTVDGDRTRAGQPLTEAFAVAASTPYLVAVGVNCCRPADVAPAITAARAVTGKPIVVYPNSGEGWDPARRRWTGASEFTETAVREWLSLGADIIGGCCRVGPADIARLVRISAEYP